MKWMIAALALLTSACVAAPQEYEPCGDDGVMSTCDGNVLFECHRGSPGFAPSPWAPDLSLGGGSSRTWTATDCTERGDVCVDDPEVGAYCVQRPEKDPRCEGRRDFCDDDVVRHCMHGYLDGWTECSTRCVEDGENAHCSDTAG